MTTAVVVMVGDICASFVAQFAFARGVLQQKRAVTSGASAVTSIAKFSGAKDSRYRRLLTKYRTNIDRIAGAERQRRIFDHHRELEEFQRATVQVAGNETVVMDKLRIEAQRRSGGKFAGGVYENQVLVPTSDASARVFTSLLQANLIDVESLITRLYNWSEYLTPEWFAFVNAPGVANTGPTTQKWIAMILYRSGYSGDQCRPVLEQMARESSDYMALCALRDLFFYTDVETGEPKARRSAENATLLHSLVQTNNNPEIRCICAKYAADVGEFTLAESICRELLEARFRGLDNLEARSPEVDHPLFRARSSAMYLMFYNLRSEWSFRTIYFLADLPRQVDAHEGKIAQDRVNLTVYPLGEMEIKAAQSLIKKVSACP